MPIEPSGRSFSGSGQFYTNHTASQRYNSQALINGSGLQGGVQKRRPPQSQTVAELTARLALSQV